MGDALNWLLGGAHYDLMVRALVLALLAGALVALWEIVRYVRTMRMERDLAYRLTMQQVYGSANDTRYSEQPQRSEPRPGVLARSFRRVVHAVGLLSILLMLAAALSMPFLGTWLERQDHLEKADYIVPLPGDEQRLIKAAELYKAGFAPRILVSEQSGGASAESQVSALEKAGVPSTATATLTPASASLADAAESLKAFAGSRKFKAIVVGSGIQSLRTKLVFEDAMPRARVLVVAQSEPDDERPWWHSEESALKTIAEASQLARYWLASNLRSFQTGSEAPAAPALAGATAKPVESVGSAPQTR
jgi:uncharacterized SAM-binding protein YcdF (DUF218 family)